MLLLAALIAHLVERRHARRLDVPVDVWRDWCPDCGHVEDGPDRGEVAGRMARHRAEHEHAKERA